VAKNKKWTLKPSGLTLERVNCGFQGGTGRRHLNDKLIDKQQQQQQQQQRQPLSVVVC